MKENRVFADAFNYLLYNGQQMIQPEKTEGNRHNRNGDSAGW